MISPRTHGAATGPRSVELPAPAVPLEAVLAVPGDAFVLETRDGVALAGIGRRAGRTWPSLAAFRPEDLPAEPGPWLVAFGFDGRGFGGAFAPFPPLEVFAPRWLYRPGPPATLVTTLAPGESLAERRAEHLAIVAALSAPPPRPARATVSRDERARYLDMVRRAKAALGPGLEKVVLSRRIEVRSATPIDPGATLTALATVGAPRRLTRYAIRRGGATFLGATPELLVARRGDLVETEAVAGTRPVADLAALAADEKEGFEHHVVVRHLIDRLAPIARLEERTPSPIVRPLAHVGHLVTPLLARLAGPVHVLELARRLHPTPAVGGAPGPVAAALIAALESSPRGLYAGGIGCFDGEGDGELFVSLRAALVRGPRATAFVGAGIVSGSDPERELAETDAKVRSVLAALGVDG